MRKIAFSFLFLFSFVASLPASELPSGPQETATFSMYCYWTGEATLGRVDGVLASRIGHWSGKEIVQVDYDPTRTNLRELTRVLRERQSLYALITSGTTTTGWPRSTATDDLAGKPRFIEPKDSLRKRHPEMLGLELTEAQAIALNSWSYFGGKRPNVLTDEQLAKLKTLKP